jgi:Mg2+/Co2+ transporter CorB
MPPQDFIGLLAEYMRDEDELSTIEEVEIGDESAQVSQIERILDELGSGAGVKEVLGRLSERVDIPDMPQQLTFENFIASVIDNKKQAIGAAKVRAQRQREFMAEKYGEDQHIERSTN